MWAIGLERMSGRSKAWNVTPEPQKRPNKLNAVIISRDSGLPQPDTRRALVRLLPTLLVLSFLCQESLNSQTYSNIVRVGRVSKLERSDAEREAAPFLLYLQSKVHGYQFHLILLRSDSEAVSAASRGEVDFLYVTPTVFVQLEVQSGATAIATAKRRVNPDIASKFVGGIVFCRAERYDIQKLSDLKGKRVMGLNPLALGGWVSALREFMDARLDPKRDFADLRFGVNPTAVAASVARGDIDAGVLSISELPQLYASGQFTQKQFRVLPPPRSYPESQELPVAASTRLYPGTAFVRMSCVSDDLAEKVAAALFEMPESGKTAGSNLVAGWTLPMNYQPVHECLKELRISPYEDFGRVTLWGAAGQHWEKVTAALIVLLGALTVAMAAALVLNLRLRSSQMALRQELDQRKQAEMTLAYQARLLEQTSDAVVAADADYRITFWNRAAEGLYKWKSSDVIGQKIEEIVPSFTSDISREEIRRIVENQGAWSGEASFEDRTGTKVYAEMAISRLKNSDGKMAGSVSGIRDITERKRLEEQLLQSQKMQAIGLLAGGVAHDFNNLLTVINGYTHLASENSNLEAETRIYLDEVLKAGTRASELTQQLLAFGRKQILQPKVLNLRQLLEETERLLRRLIGEDIELLMEVDPRTGAIKADPGQIGQVIMNLAVNARDAMPHGGKLTIRTTAVEFDGNRSKPQAEILPGRYIMLSITDTGHGMDESTQQRIFEPFFTTKEKGRGIGLGLSTVYGIVKQSGGHIWVQSEVNEGTTFTICLPETSSAPQSSQSQAPMASSRGKETVLLVEDQAEVRRLAREVLEARGYRVVEAANGAEAANICDASRNSFDLLLTDVIMPGITGTELAAQLRSRWPALKVMFMSGYSDTHLAQQEAKDARTAYLSKPFDPGVLATKVRDVLGPPAE